MCFPVGDPYIRTSCSLRGRLEYTPLGLDGYWSMYSNGELFKWWIAPYSRSTFFWKHINNVSMYSLTCCAKMDSQIYVIHHKTRNISLELLHSPSWWQPCWLRTLGINSLLLESLKQSFYECLILKITHGMLQYWNCFYKLYLQETNWQLLLWL